MTLGHLIIYFVKLPVFSGKMQRGEGGSGGVLCMDACLMKRGENGKL